MTAGVTNRTEQPVSGSSITLEVGGLTMGTKPLRSKAAAARRWRSIPFTVSGRNMRASVRWRTTRSRPTTRSTSSCRRPSRCISRSSIAATPHPRSISRGRSRLANRRSSKPCSPGRARLDDDLRRSAVVVLNDVEVERRPGPAAARYVEQGGGLFVAADHARAGRRMSIAAGDDRAARRSHARRCRSCRRARIRSSGLRAVPRAAQWRLLPRCRSTAIAI